MSTPAWTLEIFAAIMILIAEVSAGQLVLARAWTRLGSAGADIAVSRLLMGIAMAGILVPGLSALPNAAWEVVFAVVTAWFTWCLWRESRGRGALAVARGRYAPYLVYSAAMLYLFAALAGPSAEGAGMSMSGTGGMSGMAGGSMMTLHAPTLDLIFALLLIAFAVHDLDRRVGLDGYFRVLGRPSGSAGTAPRADPAYTPERLLSPAVVKGCQVVISVTMAFILIIMILVRQQHFVILYSGIVGFDLWIQVMRDIQESQLAQSREPLPSRRALLAGAGVTCAAVLAGCATHDASTGGSAPATSGAAASAGASAATGSAPAALAATSQVPDGGGKIIDGVNIVITQPESGSFKAFTAICTHEGCIVNSVSNGTINCPCHGSKFSIKNGSVVNGPATRPLAAIAITVEGTSIFQG